MQATEPRGFKSYHLRQFRAVFGPPSFLVRAVCVRTDAYTAILHSADRIRQDSKSSQIRVGSRAARSYTSAMAQGKAPTQRKTITFAVGTVEYLEQLASKGTHGNDVTNVIRTLVEEGIRSAIKEGFIPMRESGTGKTITK